MSFLDYIWNILKPRRKIYMSGHIDPYVKITGLATTFNLDDPIPKAQNFTYREFIKSSVATRFNIINMPDDTQWKKIEDLASNVIQPIREKFGPIKITSGFRSIELNKKIGGSNNSNHCRGEAADIEPILTYVKLIDIIEWIATNLEFRNLIFEYPPDGWIHVDYRKGANIKKLQVKSDYQHFVEVDLNTLLDTYK